MGFFSAEPATNHVPKAAVPQVERRRVPRENGAGLSIVAKDLTIAGDMQAVGVVRIEGRVVGSVHGGDQVLIAEGGSVEGDVVTREAVIGGRVHGCITAQERVEVQSSAVIHGDIATKRLLIQEGGRVNGNIKMESTAAEQLTVTS